MFEEFFYQRLIELRQAKGVSAREMSLAIGQGHSYISSIENQSNFPSMQSFFYICEYLQITPAEFFAPDNRYPLEYREIIENLKALDAKKLQSVKAVMKALQN